MQTDFLQYIFQAINNLLTQNLGFFDTMGQNLFRSFATILGGLVWNQVRSCRRQWQTFLPVRPFCQPASDDQLWLRDGQLLQQPDSRHRNRASTISSPTRRSFSRPRSIRRNCRRWSRRLRTSNPAWTPQPGETFSARDLRIVIILLAAAQAIAIVVIAYGFIATAVCVLVGPVFIPFFIVPKMEWLFWGWFRCFIQYAFYQVIAAAVVYVIGNLILGALGLAAHRHAFHRPAHWLVSRPIHYVSRVDLRAAENSIPYEPHFQWHGRRVIGRPLGCARRSPEQGDVMDRDARFHDAKRLYLEQYGDPMVTNTYLKIALALLSIVCVALALIDLRTIRTFQNFRPLVIRIDDLGRAEAINYHNLEYKPQDAEAKYFLSQFCALYYRRNRYTIQDDFSKSLYFLDGKLADGILDAYRKDDIIKKFITNTAAPEIDVDVKKVALEEMQTPPFRARVDFYMVYYSPADHSEMKRDLYTATFVFVFRAQVPNELIPINPLGLTITYFREDEAFK